MNLKDKNIPDYVFSKMEYLNKLIADYKSCCGYNNKNAIAYYNKLLEIKDRPNDESLYMDLTSHRNNDNLKTITHGYYLAHIDYYLFFDFYNSIEELTAYSPILEQRILYFIKNIEKKDIKNWFLSSFINNFYSYLTIKYKQPSSDNEDRLNILVNQFFCFVFIFNSFWF